MKNIKLIKPILCVLLVFFLFGCSEKYHLNQSKRHYNKAIEKGYKPSLDSIPKITLANSIKFDFKREINAIAARKIDTLLIEWCDERNLGVNTPPPSNLISNLYDSAINSIRLDTLISLNNGAKALVWFRNGAFGFEVTNYCIEEKIYMPLPWYAEKKVFFGLLLLLVLCFLLILKSR